MAADGENRRRPRFPDIRVATMAARSLRSLRATARKPEWMAGHRSGRATGDLDRPLHDGDLCGHSLRVGFLTAAAQKRYRSISCG